MRKVRYRVKGNEGSIKQCLIKKKVLVFRIKVTFMQVSNFASYNNSQFYIKGSKVAFQILGRTFYKNTKKKHPYTPKPLIFIHKTPVVEKPSDNMRN